MSFLKSSLFFVLLPGLLAAGDLTRIRYNNPGLTVDLGVGLWAWPLPMDYDGDGDLDLLVSSGGVPYEGTYFFENPGSDKLPVFKPGVRVGDYRTNVQLSPDGTVMTPGVSYPDFKTSGFENPQPAGLKTEDFHTSEGRVRANQWKRVDLDGDGVLDFVVGIGDWGTTDGTMLTTRRASGRTVRCTATSIGRGGRRAATRSRRR